MNYTSNKKPHLAKCGNTAGTMFEGLTFLDGTSVCVIGQLVGTNVMTIQTEVAYALSEH